MSSKRFASGFTVVLLFVVHSAAWSGEDIPVASLPEPVPKAIKERFPKGEMLSAEKETDKGQLKYEVKVRSAGKKYEVDVSSEGKILKVKLDD